MAAATADGVWVTDLGNPLLPAFRALIEPPMAGWQASDLALRGQTLFIHWPQRIQSWDLGDPAAPALRDDIPVASTSVRAGEGLDVLDPTDPAAPQRRGDVALPGTPQAVHVQGGVALLLTGDPAPRPPRDGVVPGAVGRLSNPCHPWAQPPPFRPGGRRPPSRHLEGPDHPGPACPRG